MKVKKIEMINLELLIDDALKLVRLIDYAVGDRDNLSDEAREFGAKLVSAIESEA